MPMDYHASYLTTQPTTGLTKRGMECDGLPWTPMCRTTVYYVYCIMVHHRHGVIIVRNTRSRVLWYVYVTCVTIIRNRMLEQLLCVYCLVAAVLPYWAVHWVLHPRVLRLVRSARRSVLYTLTHWKVVLHSIRTTLTAFLLGLQWYSRNRVFAVSRWPCFRAYMMAEDPPCWEKTE